MRISDILELLREDPLARKALTAAIFIGLCILARASALRIVRMRMTSGDPVTVRAFVQVKRATVILVVLGLTMIWATELRTMALSLTAIAVAIVIATKEVLLCVMGSLLRASAGSFNVGDRIEVGGVRGDVVDHGLLATTVVEVGPGQRWTGRSITVPNSLFLTTPLHNESHGGEFSLHWITVAVDERNTCAEAKEQLLKIAGEVCSPYLEEADRALAKRASRAGLECPRTDPYVALHVPKANERYLQLRVPVPTRDKGDIEQQILCAYVNGVEA